MRGPGVRYNPNFRPNRVYDEAAVDKAFDALATFDFGSDYELVLAIDDGVIASHGKPEIQKSLETRLAAALKPDATRGAKDFICRMLRKIGTASSVPTIAVLLPNEEGSNIARYTLQSNGGPEALKAMRDAMANLTGDLRLGMIQSLAACRDAESVAALSALASNDDVPTANAAIIALGRIGTPEAGKTLEGLLTSAPDPLKEIAADACLAYAEQAVVDGNKTEAIRVYRILSGEGQPSHVRVAATNGLLSAAGQKKE